MSVLASDASQANRGGGAPTPVAHDFRLPLRVTDFDAGLPGLLHHALQGASRREALSGLCAHLARALKLRLALLVRRAEAGTFTIEAASQENDLWLELQRIPERWDGGVSSQGPAAAALRAQAPVRLGVRDEGFALWRSAAESERVREILAVPLRDGNDTVVLELYFDSEIARGASAGTVTIGRLISGVQVLMADLTTIERQALAAHALSAAGNACFITDLEGTIVWSNPAFSALSGYSEDEVRGRNPSLLRSGQQGMRYYRELWGTIRAGKVWSGETVDRSKDGQDYVIQQTVSPVSHDGRITHYVSIHQDIGRGRRERTQLELASHHDPQTGLLTRAAFEAEFDKALAAAPQQPLALVIVAVRGMQRAISDMDQALEQRVGTALGQRVSEAFPAPDVAALVRPFEYLVLMRGNVAEPGIEARLRTLQEKLAEPLLGVVPELDVHCGTATYPLHGKTFRELWLKADRRLADEPYRRARRRAPD